MSARGERWRRPKDRWRPVGNGGRSPPFFDEVGMKKRCRPASISVCRHPLADELRQTFDRRNLKHASCWNLNSDLFPNFPEHPQRQERVATESEKVVANRNSVSMQDVTPKFRERALD